LSTAPIARSQIISRAFPEFIEGIDEPGEPSGRRNESAIPVNLVDLEFLHGANEWVIQLVFPSLMAAAEIGFRWGRQAAAGADGEKGKAQVSVVEGSLLGVLGLLLGFTMSMALSRFEVRKQLILDEANAIGTSYLRTQLLPAVDGAEMRGFLRDYLDVRLRYGDAYKDLSQLNAARRQAQQLQEKFWAIAIRCAQNNPSPLREVQLVQSLNQVIDLEASRWMAFFNHVPLAVIYVNGVVGILAVTLAGYAFGIDGARRIFPMCLLCIAIAVVLSLTMDLDSPRRGFIHVGQQPLIDLRLQLRAAGDKVYPD
jgi:hypothetical protein